LQDVVILMEKFQRIRFSSWMKFRPPRVPEWDQDEIHHQGLSQQDLLKTKQPIFIIADDVTGEATVDCAGSYV
jgi:hypothetical protein